MHFFSPANVMKRVEAIDAAETAPDVLPTARAVAKRMGNLGVVTCVCDGLIGNKMIEGCLRQANLPLLEGCSPAQVDGALGRFGMAMGPHPMEDMAGLDLQAGGRARRRAEGWIARDDPFGAVGDRLVAEGQFGLKAGEGMYGYEAGWRTPVPDADVEATFAEESGRPGSDRRAFTEAEIVSPCILPLVTEGARIVDEGIALGPGDIDVVYCNGYDFPRQRGGPMFWADALWLAEVLSPLEAYPEALDAERWRPAPLLVRLVEQGLNFADNPRRGAEPARGGSR